MKKISSDGVEGNVAWHGTQAYYDQLREIETFMYEKCDQDDVLGLFTYLKHLIRKVLPYVYKHITESELFLLKNHDDILSLQNKLKPGNVDSELKHNNNLKNTMIDIIESKWDLVNELMAKAQLYLPLKVDDIEKPAAFAQDFR